MARTIAVPVDFTGGARSRSSSETRLPSGTTSSSANAGASAASARSAARATALYRRRSAYRFTHEASAMPSCPARYSTVSHGTASGSSPRNRPT
ncbi:hypothetical protein [Streptomyces abikoensis]|uniref:Uncharacterized protein n=2 Tax=Streptomyces TaxID=1883 RepID=A0ABW7TBH6_9ACTN